MSYLLTFDLCPTYLLPFTYYLPKLHIYLPTYLLTFILSICTYQSIYLSTYITYLPPYEKNQSSNVIIHINKNIHRSSRKDVKCIWYHIVLQSGGVV